MVDVEADDFAAGIEVDVQALGHLTRFDARFRLQFDVETIRLGVIVQLHGLSFTKFRSKNALWTVSPSSSVTTRSIRNLPSRVSSTSIQWRMRPSAWVSRRSGAISAAAHHARKT